MRKVKNLGSIRQINIKTGKVIKVWKNGGEIERKLDLDRSAITKVCNQVRKTHGGFGWERTTITPELKPEERVKYYNDRWHS